MRRLIAAEQEMIAVIDQLSEPVVNERPATAAGVPGRLVERDAEAGAAQRDCSREAGEAGADDVNVRRCHA